MKVLVLFTYGISLIDWKKSGLFEREIKLYEKLSNNNVSFTFLTFGGEKDLIFQNQMNNIKIIPIYEKVNKSRFKIINFLKSLTLPLLMKDIFNEVDIFKSNQLNGSWILLLAKFIYKKPLFIRTGFNLYEFSKKQNKNIFKILFFKYLTKFSFKFSDLFTVTSLNDKKNLEDFVNTQTKDIEIRSNWIELRDYVDLNNRYDDKLLAVGRLESQKNFENLIYSLQGSYITLDIVGSGSQKDFLINLSKKLKVNINFIDYLDNNLLLSTYEKYKYFVLSSMYEGNPKALLEAMSSGCIPIVNDISSIKEIIIDQYNGLVFDFNKISTYKIENLIFDNKEILNSLSKNAYNTVVKSNSLNEYIKREATDYRLLIGD